MKTILKGVFTIMVISFAVACQQQTKADNSPEATAKKYIEAMRTANIDAALKLGTQRTQSVLNNIKESLKQLPPEEKEILLNSLKISDKSLSCALSSGMMRCSACCDTDGGETDIILVQEDDKWLIEIEN